MAGAHDEHIDGSRQRRSHGHLLEDPGVPAVGSWLVALPLNGSSFHYSYDFDQQRAGAQRF